MIKRSVAGALVVAALAARTGWLFVAHVFGLAPRFQVESAALLFVAAGLIFTPFHLSAADLTPSSHLGPSPDSRRIGLGDAVPALWIWIAFCVLALVLYRPAFGVGFLSDDFVFVKRVLAWDIGPGPVRPALFRPLPLLLWAALIHAGGGPMTLHLVNVLFHGTNAFLTTRLLGGWITDRRWAVAGGLIMLTAPAFPEAVVWCSGVFDLSATLLVLAAVLTARRYSSDTRVRTRVAFAALTIAAVLSKETAIVAPALVLVDAWIRRSLPRPLAVDAAWLMMAAIVHAALRVTHAFGIVRPPISRYLVQRTVFGLFGAAIVPWHADVVQSIPWVPLAGGFVVLLLASVFFIAPVSMARVKIGTAGVLWMLASVAPLWPNFFIASDLQQSRYLYLPFVGWAAVLIALAAPQDGSVRIVRRLRAVGIAILVAIGAYGIVRHTGPWIDAAALRDSVFSAASSNSRLRSCSHVAMQGLPDSVNGAYVFRNGGAEAFALKMSVDISPTATRSCSFRWRPLEQAFLADE